MAPMTTSSAVVYVRARASSLDPITPLVGLVALVVYSLHGFGGVLNRDLGVYAYAGQQFADGVPPYEGILNRAGPLAHMLPGVGMVAGRLVGVDDVTSARVLFMLFAVGCRVRHLCGRPRPVPVAVGRAGVGRLPARASWASSSTPRTGRARRRRWSCSCCWRCGC